MIKNRKFIFDNQYSSIFIITLSCMLVFIYAVITFMLKKEYNKDELFLITNFFWLAVVIFFAIKGVRENLLILTFLLCFFSFLMGQKIVFFFIDGSINQFRTFELLELNSSEYLTYICLLFLSIVSLIWGYIIVQNIKIKKQYTSHKELDNKQRNVLRIGFAITLTAYIIMQVMIIYQKSQYDYVESYLHSYNVPFYVYELANLFHGTTFLYLASKPKKKEALIICALFLIADGTLNALTGRRAALGKDIFLILLYLVLFDKTLPKKEKIINKKTVSMMCCGLVGIMGVFVLIEILREDKSASFSSPFSILVYFLTTVGGSDSVIGNTIRLQDSFSANGFTYLFNPILMIIKHYTPWYPETPTVQGLAYVQAHNSFAHHISYMVSPDLYLLGHGMGSSYIAELYLAAGIPGAIIGNVLLGGIICLLGNFSLNKHSMCLKTIAFSIIFSLFLLPRSGVFDSLLTTIYVIIAMLIYKLIWYIMGKKWSFRGKNGK